METLANITQTDINNGILIRMLAKAGIPDIPEYVKNFHRDTEEIIIDEFEHPTANKADNDEQIVPPADVQSWITGLRLRLDDPIKPLLLEQEQQEKQQGPKDVQDWIQRLRPHLDDPVQQSLPNQQHQEKPPPSDLKSWMQHITPSDSHSSTDTTTTSDDYTPLTGNLGTWLNDWSKSLTEQPPPTSLDNWLQCLIPKDMHESIAKANNPKGRLNTYLDAAQQVLSQHGYDVSNEVKPPTNIQTKSGMFGNVKQMYFLVSCAHSHSYSTHSLLIFYLVENIG